MTATEEFREFAEALGRLYHSRQQRTREGRPASPSCTLPMANVALFDNDTCRRGFPATSLSCAIRASPSNAAHFCRPIRSSGTSRGTTVPNEGQLFAG